MLRLHYTVETLTAPKSYFPVTKLWYFAKLSNISASTVGAIFSFVCGPVIRWLRLLLVSGEQNNKRIPPLQIVFKNEAVMSRCFLQNLTTAWCFCNTTLIRASIGMLKYNDIFLYKKSIDIYDIEYNYDISVTPTIWHCKYVLLPHCAFILFHKLLKTVYSEKKKCT